MRIAIAITLAWTFILTFASAQESDKLDVPKHSLTVALQEKLDATSQTHKLPAIWAGKFTLEKPAVICVTGVRKLGDSQLATVDDPIHLGSCTKAMTAVLIGQLCTEGKLRLDSPLKELFSDMEEVTKSDWADVTLIELMQHRSGAAANVDYFAIDRAHPDSVVTARQAVLKKMVSIRRPRKRSFVYSNIGYIVLGHVIEKIEQNSWEAVIEERLFKPLDIKSAAFGPVGLPDSLPAGSEVLPNRPWGHSESVGLADVARLVLGGGGVANLKAEQIDNSRCLGPAGRVHMHMQDWAKFVSKFIKPDGNKDLRISDEVWRDLYTPAHEAQGEERYAAGWILVDNPPVGKGLFHNGSNTTWYCYAFADHSSQSCVLVATNAFNQAARRECDAIARFMLKL